MHKHIYFELSFEIIKVRENPNFSKTSLIFCKACMMAQISQSEQKCVLNVLPLDTTSHTTSGMSAIDLEILV